MAYQKRSISEIVQKDITIEYISYSLSYSTVIVPSMVYSIFTNAVLSDTTAAAG
jgi:hypothetical protein